MRRGCRHICCVNIHGSIHSVLERPVIVASWQVIINQIGTLNQAGGKLSTGGEGATWRDLSLPWALAGWLGPTLAKSLFDNWTG